MIEITLNVSENRRMEQQQFKVTFAVGPKLIVSMVIILFCVIAFLNKSTTLLITDDKRAYTFDFQLQTNQLLGRQLVGITDQSLSTLRVVLGTVDPSEKNVSRGKAEALKAVVNNQTTLIQAGVYLMEDDGVKALIQVPRSEEVERLALQPTDLELSQEIVQENLEELKQKGLAFVSLAKLGGKPLVGIILADNKYYEESNQKKLPIAVGVLNLEPFVKELQADSFTVAIDDGTVLYSTEPDYFFKKDAIKQSTLFSNASATKSPNATSEFQENGRTYLGSFVKPGRGLVIISQTDSAKAMASIRILTQKFILMALIAIGLSVIFVIIFAKTLTNPITDLFEATKNLASGNFDVELKPKYRDELGALTNAFNFMSKKISELIEEQKKKAQLENEIAIASTVQQTLIPQPDYEDAHIAIHSSYKSASSCGGDWWGHFKVGNKMAIMISDATGHGIPSALITAAARSCFSLINKLAHEDPNFTLSPGLFLSHANRVIHESSYGQIMMTFFCAILDFDKMTLTYSSAGHNPPWLFKYKDGAFTLTSLVANGDRLGENNDIKPFEEKTVAISANDMLFLYTDGVVEGKNLDGQMFGKKRVLSLVKENLNSGIKVTVEKLSSEFLQYNTGKEFDDDVTLVTAKILEHGKQSTV